MMSLGDTKNAALATKTADNPKPENPRTSPAAKAHTASVLKCSGGSIVQWRECYGLKRARPAISWVAKEVAAVFKSSL
jgi:hypothetical protein